MPHSPMYYVTIHEVHSEQTVFSGVLHGKLGRLLADGGPIRSAVETTDAGGRLSPSQKKKAHAHASR